MSYADLATSETMSWLLEGDPSVRWQVHEYLVGSDPVTVTAERSKVGLEGWGATFLHLQSPDGTWGGGWYNPKWTSTHYTMLALRRLGLPADNEQAGRAAGLLLDNGFRFDHGIRFNGDPALGGETCISGMSLSLFSTFGDDDERTHLLAAHLLDEQMGDGGWNCQRSNGATHSSFHTTASALEGLADYTSRFPGSESPIAAAMDSGREFLLEHRLFRSHRTGEVVSEAMTRFPFPPQWHYDVLRALDHFAVSRAPVDERAGEAITLLESRASAGRWNQYRGHEGQYHFEIERVGEPGRANTLRALRDLKWWDG